MIGYFKNSNLPTFIIDRLGKNDAPEKQQRNLLLGILVASLVVVFILQMGWMEKSISWTKWGGLFLTFVIAGIGIASALPLGIILALGRRSKLKAVSVLSMGFHRSVSFCAVNNSVVYGNHYVPSVYARGFCPQ